MARKSNRSSSITSLLNSPTASEPTVVAGPKTDSVESEAIWERYDALDDLSPGQQEFSALRELDLAPKNTRYRLIWLMLLLVGAGSYSAYEVLINDSNPFDSMLVTLDELIKFGLSHDAARPPADAAVAASIAPKVSGTKAAPRPASDQTQSSPAGDTWKVYGGLPNKLPSQSATADAAEGAQAVTDELVAGMDHEFAYQRFKAIQEIRKQKVTAATDLLQQGLIDEKFWNRMYSAITLAEFGVPVTVAELSGVIEDTRSELIANFFRRFLKKPSDGELYIMRQMLRLADERGRLVLLQAIARSRDDLRNLYLVAATMENSAKIKGWATTAVQALSLPNDELNKLQEQILQLSGANSATASVAHGENNVEDDEKTD